MEIFGKYSMFFSGFKSFLILFGSFFARDLNHRPPDPFFSSIWTDFHQNPMAMTHLGDFLLAEIFLIRDIFYSSAPSIQLSGKKRSDPETLGIPREF